MQPLSGTIELADIVARAIGRRPSDPIHPATRTFQALRIFVNRELDELAEALAASERMLGEGGRLVVVSFHSLEDRIVKRFLADRSAVRSGGSRHAPERGVAAADLRASRQAAPSRPAHAEIAGQSARPVGQAARRPADRRRRRAALDPAAIGVPELPSFSSRSN